jgi:hypothetical protein
MNCVNLLLEKMILNTPPTLVETILSANPSLKVLRGDRVRIIEWEDEVSPDGSIMHKRKLNLFFMEMVH